VSVVVVGGGLAGCMAALAAARSSPDASVTVVTQARTTMREASGLVDVLGYAPDSDGPIADPFAAVSALPAEHPYSTVGVDELRDGLALFDEAVGDAYHGADTDRNALVPTCWGRVKPTARYPTSVAAGLASQRRPATLVGFEELSGFDAPLSADRLSGRLPYRIDGITVPAPTELSPGPEPVDRTPLRVARALDRGDGALDTLVDSLDIYLNRKDRAGFPAVLGGDRAGEVRRELEDRLGVAVFEVPTGPPSVPGVRLRTLLGDALSAAGVHVRTETTVVDVESADGRVDGLLLDGGEDPEGSQGERIGGSQFVLATGGVAGGGVRGRRDGVTEPVFGCHVDAPDDRSAWGATRPLGDHPFARFGVDVDASLRPLTAGGDPEFSNLRAAGSVIGGYDFAAEKSGSGVSVATGYAAGIRAGGSAR
jgi:glycerol-3-phosphate dehydrogenase subunit B